MELVHSKNINYINYNPNYQFQHTRSYQTKSDSRLFVSLTIFYQILNYNTNEINLVNYIKIKVYKNISKFLACVPCNNISSQYILSFHDCTH